MMDATQFVEQLGFSRGVLRARTAVVVGAGQPIGRECARALAWLGARVVAADCNLVQGSETSTLIQAAGGEAIVVHLPDFSCASAALLTARSHAAFGTVSILVTIQPAIGLAEGQPAAALPIEIWRAFLPEMTARKQGTLLHIAPGGTAVSRKSWQELTFSLAYEANLTIVRLEPILPEDLAGLPAMIKGEPAALTAAAAGCLAAQLTHEYHGKSVSAETVLRRCAEQHLLP